MNKPPDPHPRLLQPSPESINPVFLPFSATSTDRLSYLVKSILLCHHCFARSLGCNFLASPQGGSAGVMRRCVQISLKQLTDAHPPAVYGANQGIKLAIGWAKLQVDAFIRSPLDPSYLSNIDEAASGLSDSSAVDSDVIIPCSFMVMTKVLMRLVDTMHISVINCVPLLRFPWLFIWVIGPSLQYPPHLLPCYCCVSMSKSSSQVPLSLSSDSNGSGSAIVISFGLLDDLKHDSSCGFLDLLLGCFSNEPSTCWCVVLGWVVRFSLRCFGDCPIVDWTWSCRTYVINNNAILFMCNLNRRNHVVMQMNCSRFSCYFGRHSLRSKFLGNGVRTVSGSVIRLSVALRCGGQIWLLTPECNLPCYHGSMWRISPRGTFSFKPSSLLFGVFRLQLYVSIYGNVFSSVTISLFNPPIPFELLHYSLTGIFAWDNKSSGPSHSHRVFLLMDVSLSQWLKCFQVCSKGVFSFNKNILYLLNVFAIYSFALPSLFCRISCSNLVEKFLPESERTIWWNIWSMIKLGDATSGCIRLQAQKLQMREISQTKAILSWIGNHPTLICC